MRIHDHIEMAEYMVCGCCYGLSMEYYESWSELSLPGQHPLPLSHFALDTLSQELDLAKRKVRDRFLALV